jgi:hypothetical protein
MNADTSKTTFSFIVVIFGIVIHVAIFIIISRHF